MQKNTRRIREIPIYDKVRVLGLYQTFVKFAMMGWIRIDFALLNTFTIFDFYRFFSIFYVKILLVVSLV